MTDIIQSDTLNLKKWQDIQDKNAILKTELGERKAEIENLKMQINSIHNFNLAMQTLDQNGNIVKINDAWSVMFGYSSLDVLGKSFSHFLYGESRKHFEEQLKDLLKGTTSVANIFKIKDKTGNVFHVFLAAKRSKTVNDNVAFVECFLYPVKNENEFSRDFNESSNELSYSLSISKKGDEKLVKENLSSIRLISEIALRESETKYKELVNRSLVGIYITQNHVMRYCNQRLAEIFGYENADELNNKNVRDLVAAESWELVDKQVQLRESGKENTIHYEFKGIKKDGTIFNIEALGSKIMYQGKPAIHGTLLDITERKKAEIAIKESEEKYRTVVENANEAIIIIQDFMLKYFNQKTINMLNYDSQEIENKRIDEFIYPEDKEKVIGFHKLRMLGKEAPEQYTFRIVTKDNQIKWADARVILIQWNGKAASLAFINDTSDKKKAEDQLRESEEKYRTMVELAPEAIVTTDLKGYIKSYNSSFLKFTFNLPDKIIHDKLVDVMCVHNKYLAKFSQGINRILTGKSIKTFEFYSYPGNGRKIWGEVYTGPLFKENKIIGIQYFIIDITERKRAELIQKVLLRISQASSISNNLKELLKFIHKELSKLIDTSNFFVALYDEKNDTYSFPLYIDKYDNPDSISPGRLKKTLTDYVRRTGRSLLADRKKITELEKVGEIELVGTDCKVWMGVPLKNGNSTIGVIVVQSYEEASLYSKRDLDLLSFVSEKISLTIEHKRVEDALFAEKERLDVTLYSITDGVISTNIDGKVILMNKVAEKLTGWLSADAFGKAIEIVFDHYYYPKRKKCSNPVTSLIESGKIVDCDIDKLLISKKQEEYLVLVNGALIKDNDGNMIGSVIVFRDISKNRKFEEEMQKATKLESIGILAGGIAHDFNNLLTGIIGNISMAREEIGTKHCIAELLVDAEKAALRSQDLTQQLLTFSKGGHPIKKKTTLVSDLIKDSVRFALRGSKCTYNFYNDKKLWPVEIDEGQISQVFNNLIINADQAMPQGGVINIAIENFQAHEIGSHMKEGKYVKITVQDTGIGIQREHLPKIFDPFFTTKQKGSGLGLATSYSIIKKHGGYIDVKSVLSEGSIFEVYLPAVVTDIPDIEKKDIQYLKGEGRILVMDDEVIVRRVIGKMLRLTGFEVDFAENGYEAIDLYKRAIMENKPYLFVVMDLTIPGSIGGKETIDILKKYDKNVKAIVSSGYFNDPILSHYQDYGFAGCISKPFKLEELILVIKEVIS